jgi:hypothetical protein
VSLTTLFELADNLESVARGEKLNTVLAGKLASRISEITLPRSALSTAEKNSLSFGYWTEKHIDNQRKINLRNAIEKAANDANKLKDIRAGLAPFLRDTLVGLNYIHYAPPGAQVLHTNPLFVAVTISSEFRARSKPGSTRRCSVRVGRPTPADDWWGRWHRCPMRWRSGTEFPDPDARAGADLGRPGSADDPERVIPRWWDVAPSQLHWVGLHMGTPNRCWPKAW